MTDMTTHQCKDCGTAFDQAAQKDWSPAGTCYPCWDAALIELNKHGKFVNASKYYEEQKDAEIERLKAGIAEIQTKASIIKAAALYPADELIADEIIRKCVELLKRAGDE